MGKNRRIKIMNLVEAKSKSFRGREIKTKSREYSSSAERSGCRLSGTDCRHLTLSRNRRGNSLGNEWDIPAHSDSQDPLEKKLSDPYHWILFF